MSIEIWNENNYSLLARTLNELISRDEALTPAALARKLNIPTNKITRILNGDVTDPKASTLVQLADCFGISIDQLLGHEPILRVGDFGDLVPSQLIPVFEMKRMDDQKKPLEWYRWSEGGANGDYRALNIDTDLYEPTFPKGSLIIIDNDLPPEDRAFIIVITNKKHYSIKKYVLDGDIQYLYPVNPELPIEKFDVSRHSISGVILEVHQKLRPNK